MGPGLMRQAPRALINLTTWAGWKEMRGLIVRLLPILLNWVTPLMYKNGLVNGLDSGPSY